MSLMSDKHCDGQHDEQRLLKQSEYDFSREQAEAFKGKHYCMECQEKLKNDSSKIDMSRIIKRRFFTFRDGVVHYL